MTSRSRRSRGRFLVIDGPDGSGKTSQVRRLTSRLRRSGFKVHHLREPGGTRIGERIRELLLDRRLLEMEAVTEVYLYMAARAQLVREKLLPLLQRGELVCCERFLSSTLVYQGLAGKLGLRTVERVAGPALARVQPDRVFLLDCPLAVSRARLGRTRDRIEAREEAYHRKVRNGYRRLARLYPGRYRLIDSTRSPGEVAEEIWRQVRRLLPR